VSDHSSSIEEPSFSVVIPTYDRANLLPKTLRTVFDQSYPAKEILVVDNCSTDDTEERLAPLIAAGRIRYIRHDRNYERARSRNTGMENATGDYVTFLDSDDLMYRDNLADAAELVRLRGPKFFHNRYELVDSSGRRLHLYRQPPLANHRKAILEGNFLSCIGVFLHREIYSRLRFDTDPAITGSEDWAFWIRVCADYEPARIERVNSGVVHHGGRTIQTIDLSGLRQRLELLRGKILADDHLREVYGPIMDRYDIGCRIYMGAVANSARRFGEARRILFEAFQIDPRMAFRQHFLRPLRIALFEIDKGT
jgi:glycosyltransferase involved in cell wall biosynthesis